MKRTKKTARPKKKNKNMGTIAAIIFEIIRMRYPSIYTSFYKGASDQVKRKLVAPGRREANRK